MNELLPSNPNEIRLAPPPSPVEQMAEAIERGDLAATALANVYYVDAVLGEAQYRQRKAKVYTEIHAVGDGLVIVPGVEHLQTHWASVIGEHSMFDVARPAYADTAARQLEQEISQALPLNKDSVVGKGELSLTSEGSYLLEIGVLHDRGQDKFNWVAELAANARDYPNFEVVYKPVTSKIEQPLSGELPLRSQADIDPHYVAVPNEQLGVRSGIVTGASEVMLPCVDRIRDNELKRSARLILDSVEGKVGHHEPIYAATDMQRPGIFTIKAGDLEQQLFIHYTIDTKHERATALIIYNNARNTAEFNDLRQLVTLAVTTRLEHDIPDPSKWFITEDFETIDPDKLKES